MKNILQKLYNNESLDTTEAKQILLEIGNLQHNELQIAAFLSCYNMRLPTQNELLGFRNAMLEMALPITINEKNILDIVGTGGDGKNTFNISTLACFICAGANVKVVKHGNYGVSSISGSSNVLEFLGIQFSNNIDILNHQVESANITFLHAPLFHPSMKNIANIRKHLQVKTVFNLLGPLVNPSKPSHQIIGVANEKIGYLYKEVLANTETNFNIVHSKDGYDEVSLTNDTIVFSKEKNEIISPKTFNSKVLNQSDLFGGNTIEDNAKIFLNILNNKGTEAQNKVVIANAALGISLCKNINLESALKAATESLSSLKAKYCFDKLIKN